MSNAYSPFDPSQQGQQRHTPQIPNRKEAKQTQREQALQRQQAYQRRPPAQQQPTTIKLTQNRTNATPTATPPKTSTPRNISKEETTLRNMLGDRYKHPLKPTQSKREQPLMTVGDRPINQSATKGSWTYYGYPEYEGKYAAPTRPAGAGLTTYIQSLKEVNGALQITYGNSALEAEYQVSKNFWESQGFPELAGYTPVTFNEEDQYVKSVEKTDSGINIIIGDKSNEAWWKEQGFPEYGAYAPITFEETDQYIKSVEKTDSGINVVMGDKSDEQFWKDLGREDLAAKGYKPIEAPEGFTLKDFAGVEETGEGIKILFNKPITEQPTDVFEEPVFEQGQQELLPSPSIYEGFAEMRNANAELEQKRYFDSIITNIEQTDKSFLEKNNLTFQGLPTTETKLNAIVAYRDLKLAESQKFYGEFGRPELAQKYGVFEIPKGYTKQDISLKETKTELQIEFAPKQTIASPGLLTSEQIKSIATNIREVDPSFTGTTIPEIVAYRDLKLSEAQTYYTKIGKPELAQKYGVPNIPEGYLATDIKEATYGVNTKDYSLGLTFGKNVWTAPSATPISRLEYNLVSDPKQLVNAQIKQLELERVGISPTMQGTRVFELTIEGYSNRQMAIFNSLNPENQKLFQEWQQERTITPVKNLGLMLGAVVTLPVLGPIGAVKAVGYGLGISQGIKGLQGGGLLTGQELYDTVTGSILFMGASKGIIGGLSSAKTLAPIVTGVGKGATQAVSSFLGQTGVNIGLGVGGNYVLSGGSLNSAREGGEWAAAFSVLGVAFRYVPKVFAGTKISVGMRTEITPVFKEPLMWASNVIRQSDIAIYSAKLVNEARMVNRIIQTGTSLRNLESKQSFDNIMYGINDTKIIGKPSTQKNLVNREFGVGVKAEEIIQTEYFKYNRDIPDILQTRYAEYNIVPNNRRPITSITKAEKPTGDYIDFVSKGSNYNKSVTLNKNFAIDNAIFRDLMIGFGAPKEFITRSRINFNEPKRLTLTDALSEQFTPKGSNVNKTIIPHDKFAAELKDLLIIPKESPARILKGSNYGKTVKLNQEFAVNNAIIRDLMIGMGTPKTFTGSLNIRETKTNITTPTSRGSNANKRVRVTKSADQELYDLLHPDLVEQKTIQQAADRYGSLKEVKLPKETQPPKASIQLKNLSKKELQLLDRNIGKINYDKFLNAKGEPVNILKTVQPKYEVFPEYPQKKVAVTKPFEAPKNLSATELRILRENIGVSNYKTLNKTAFVAEKTILQTKSVPTIKQVKVIKAFKFTENVLPLNAKATATRNGLLLVELAKTIQATTAKAKQDFVLPTTTKRALRTRQTQQQQQTTKRINQQFTLQRAKTTTKPKTKSLTETFPVLTQTPTQKRESLKISSYTKRAFSLTPQQEQQKRKQTIKMPRLTQLQMPSVTQQPKTTQQPFTIPKTTPFTIPKTKLFVVVVNASGELPKTPQIPKYQTLQKTVQSQTVKTRYPPFSLPTFPPPPRRTPEQTKITQKPKPITQWRKESKKNKVKNKLTGTWFEKSHPVKTYKQMLNTFNIGTQGGKQRRPQRL